MIPFECPFPDILSLVGHGRVSPLQDFPGRLTHLGDLEDGVSALAEGGELDPASVDVLLQVQFLMATEYLLPQ